MMLIIQVLAITILIATAAAADTTCRRNSFGTTTCSNGAEYRRNSFGTIREVTPPRDDDRKTNRATSCRENAFGTLVCR